MSVAFAILTSDPNVLPCELDRLRRDVRLTRDGAAHAAIGVGSYAPPDDVLLHRFPSNAPPPDLTGLIYDQCSDAVLYHERDLPVGMSLDDNTQPFRFRKWLFLHVGELGGYRAFKQQLWDELPEFLKRSVRGETDSEVAFAGFLKHLRDSGQLDDPALEPTKAAQILGVTARRIEAIARERAPERRSRIDFVASNENMLLALRRGPQPLFFRVLEGVSRCPACNLDRSTPGTQPRVRAHERCRSVAVATHPVRPEGWRELREGEVLAVGRDLQPQWVHA